jgi:hypothetical protein
MAGYSGTPLAKKLGIKAGSRIFVSNAPPHYDELLAPLPESVTRARGIDARTQLVHVFVTTQTQLHKALQAAMAKLAPDAALWVSWPKKSSKVPTDVTEDSIRDIALPMGLVDIKVCAVDEVWSGLKLVIRKQLRAREEGKA